jgi:DUF971 family protein
MNTHPTDLQLVEDNALLIKWSDGQERRYSLRELRDACPCATCREKRTGEQQAPTLLPVLSAAEAEPLRIEGMKPVGSYAYTIAFSDGHDTGIFSFDLLQQLGERVT